MKVHLIRTEDFNEVHFENVLDLLSAYPGAIEFVKGGVVYLSKPSGKKVFPDADDFGKQEEVILSSPYKESRKMNAFDLDYERPIFPYKRKYYKWKVFFKLMQTYRKSQNISENDLVILLTNEYNDKNWFAFIDERFKNIFVHTDDWPWFFGVNTDIRFPIAYEISSWILKSMLYKNQKELLNEIHPISMGCINDLCQNKKDITIKMRTGDVCEDCMNLIESRDIPPHYLYQLFSIIDGIRSNLMFRKRSGVTMKDSRIRVDFSSKKIYLTDFGNLAVRLNPKEFSIYVLFLQYPKGLALNSLSDYNFEILQIYQNVSGRINLLEMSNTISLLTNYLESEINITISRIKSKFKTELGESLAKNYYIQQFAPGIHGIPLNRELVFIEKED